MVQDFDAGSPKIERRGLFGAVAAGAVGSVAVAVVGRAAEPPPPPATAAPSAGLPSASDAHAETAAPPREAQLISRSGSDHMVDVLKSLSLDYITTMPGSTFRGLHESIINYGDNQKPELLTCLHEEIAVGMGHGYAKIAGKPLGALLHGVVGLQHGSMAIYNAWADRVPVLVFVGNTLAAQERRPGVEWAHSAQDNAAMVRDYCKWDDMPGSLEQFGESTVRAYRIATTPPFGPTLIVVDGELQEKAISDKPGEVPRLTALSAPVGDPHAVARAAELLVGASNPVIVADRLVTSAQGMRALVELAETLQAPVIDKGGRMNIPSRHHLNHSGSAAALLRGADVVLGLEVWDLYGTVNQYRDRIVRDSQPLIKPGAKLVSIGAADLLMRANMQDFQRYQAADLAISGDGQATLPMLLDAVHRAMPQSRDAFEARGDKLREAWGENQERSRHTAAYGWDARPISVARLCAVLGRVIENEDWALVTDSIFQSNWPLKLWDFREPNQHAGGSGGYGVGYTGPASLGAALAHRDAGGRIAVAIMGDGELMCCPGVFWTAAHHKVPLLTVMHNNRAYHQEVMHIQTMGNRHSRGLGRAGIGTAIDNPDIDFAKLADSMGVWSRGPITDPSDLEPALRQALAIVKQGQPALVDVVCQPR